ncbi:small oligopeptide transporter [Microthyrium microscopicum]|uniref:Small oligopeptide transporter n=1 Tax=Microthyrium microscopicum TaxID=703497 RepID=A0A6A6UHU4_9PEZI|nr:small oligopeptide transporter [Microthyrium microscopicum]
MHAWDPNVPNDKLNVLDAAVEKHDTDAEEALDQELEENSPYPEVVAAVSNTDDTTIEGGTFRAWFLGLLFVTLGSGLNMLFSLRQPSISIGALVAQLCVYPIGVLWAKVVPSKEFSVFGKKFSFNPGPFNKKEHTLIVVMANVTFNGGSAYSTLTIEAQRGFYGLDWGFGFAILFTLATQMTGLGLAGLFRNFLVYPSSMIWPSTLPNCALFNTLHDGKTAMDPADTNGWRISRFKFFTYVLVGGFFWYWFPGFIWQGLSVFAWVTWIKPNNVIVNQIFGGTSGFSYGAPFTIFTLDWTTINGYIGSPLVVPWHAIANTMIGLVIFTWVLATGINYSGKWYSDYLPVSDSNSYDNMGHRYNVTRILKPDWTLDPVKYKTYSPIFLSTTFALQYGLSFASIVAVVTHTAAFHGKEIWQRFRNVRAEPKDIHMKLMQSYPEVPQWWFITMFVIMLAIGLATVLHYPLQLPWWAFFVSILMAAFFMVPIGMIQAITNIPIGLNVITEFVVAYMLPGRPMAMMAFKTLGYITMAQGITYAQDQKMAMYMKVKPRTIFWGQLWASVLSSFVQVGVLLWAFTNIEGICTKDQPNKFTCPNGRVFFNASIVWGVIGPGRMFGPGSIYESLQWFWMIGALCPIIIWVVARKFPRGPWRYLHFPIIFGGTGQIPPAVPMNYLMWGIIGYIFNKHIRSRARGWWSNYNYILSAALDTGLALCTIVIFCTLTMTKTEPPSWWGNNVVSTTLDSQGTAIRKVLPDGEKFGPPVGSW